MLVAALTLLASGGNPAVTLTDEGSRVVLANGVVSFAVDKSTATIREMRLGESPNLAGRGAYFAVVDSKGKDGWDVKNGAFQVVRNTPDLAEVSVKAPIGGCDFDQHYVLRRGDPGFYVFVKMDRPASYPPEVLAQVRWSCYLNPQLFDYQFANDQERGPIPDLTGAPAVQDATYRLKDGTIYTKYNYCDYVEGHYVHGITGAAPGSYGAFIVMGSNEYLGAPTKQEITVHAGPIIHRFLHSGHFLPRNLANPTLPDGWTKMCGPWFVYLNKGDSPDEMWTLAKRRADLERKLWPYPWMADSDYPLVRSTVSGTLRIAGTNRPGANALIVLTAPTQDWQTQILGYNFSVRADSTGRFTIPNVRPGAYSLFAAIPGFVEEFQRKNVVVSPPNDLNLGSLTFAPAPVKKLLWQIGYPDRKTTGFKLSDRPRQYGLGALVPANLTFVVGKSDPAQDWYYAQAKPGDWNVAFQVDGSLPKGEGVLTIGVAGQTNDPRLEVLLNGASLGTITTAGNSSALYRSAVLGSSYYEVKEIRFPAEKLAAGANVLALRMHQGSIMYDTVRLAIE